MINDHGLLVRPALMRPEVQHTKEIEMYPVHRSPEQGHTIRCMAKAMIVAVENYRDMIISDHRTVGLDMAYADHEFRLALQDNMPLQWADEYLREGVTECICPVIITGTHQASCSVTRGEACDCAYREENQRV